MKYFLIILALILLIAVISLNIKTTSEKKVNMKEQKNEIVKTDSIQVIEEEEPQIPQNLFPEIYNASQLTEDKSLEIIRFNINKDSIETTKDDFTLTFTLPKKVIKADVILLVNKVKKDLFYQIEAGKYEFRNIKLDKGENIVEVFYRIGKRKSTSSIIRIIKKENNSEGILTKD